LLHPAAGHGVRRVSGAGFPIPDLASQIAAGGPNPSSRRTFTPPEGTLDCSRTTSPWPLPPCRWPPVPLGSSPVAVAGAVLRAPRDRSLDFEALLRRRVQTPRDRCRSSGALSFHGLCSPSRSLPTNTSTQACARGAADDENPKTTVRISNKLRSASTASVRCGPTPAFLAEAELGDDHRLIPKNQTRPPGTRHRCHSEECHQPGCAAQPEGCRRLAPGPFLVTRTSAVEYPKRSESLLRFTGERPEAGPPEPDRSQDPGRRTRSRSHGHEPVPKKSIQS